MLIEKLHSFLEGNNKKETEEYQKSALSPTDTHSCGRQIYYRFNKAPQEHPDGRTCVIFKTGDAIHEMIQGWLDELKLQLKDEFRMEENYKGVRITGYIDSLCVIDNEPYVVELKSQKDWVWKGNFGNKKVEKDYLKEAKPEHIGQVQIYMWATGIKKAIVLYLNKNTQDLKEFHIDYDEKEAIRILDRFVKIKQFVDDDVTPERDFKEDSFQCTYCNFKAHCYGDEK